MALVSCARVGDALTEWLDSASELKKTALCEALDCGGIEGQAFSTLDTDSLAFTGAGTEDEPLTANVQVSTEEGNRVTVDATGVHVAAELPESTAADQGKHLVVDETGTPVWQEDEPCYVPVEQTTGVNRPLTLEDNGKLLMGGPINIVIPAASSSWPIGYRVDLRGPAQAIPTLGVTIASNENMKKVVANGGATLIKTGTNEWWLAGALED